MLDRDLYRLKTKQAYNTNLPPFIYFLSFPPQRRHRPIPQRQHRPNHRPLCRRSQPRHFLPCPRPQVCVVYHRSRADPIPFVYPPSLTNPPICRSVPPSPPSYLMHVFPFCPFPAHICTYSFIYFGLLEWGLVGWLAGWFVVGGLVGLFLVGGFVGSCLSASHPLYDALVRGVF